MEVVQSVRFDTASMHVVYEISSAATTTPAAFILRSEDGLMYAPQTPVFVMDDDDGRRKAGTVLLVEDVTMVRTYSVLMGGGGSDRCVVRRGVDGRKLLYRPAGSAVDRSSSSALEGGGEAVSAVSGAYGAEEGNDAMELPPMPPLSSLDDPSTALEANTENQHRQHLLREHQYLKAPPNTRGMKHGEWVPSKVRYQSYTCRLNHTHTQRKGLKKQTRRYCSCEPCLWLCEDCYQEHLSKVFNGTNVGL